MSKAMVKRRKNPMAKRNVGMTYTRAALVGAIGGGAIAALRYNDLPQPPTRTKAVVSGAVQGAVIVTVAALLYREYKVYGV